MRSYLVNIKDGPIFKCFSLPLFCFVMFLFGGWGLLSKRYRTARVLRGRYCNDVSSKLQAISGESLM